MDALGPRSRANGVQLVRRVEARGKAVGIERRGKVVARLAPPPRAGTAPRKPWQQLLGAGELFLDRLGSHGV